MQNLSMNGSSLQMEIGNCPYHEYLLVLQPNADVNEKLLNIKEEFSQKFKIQSAKHSYSPIILASFFQFKMIENRLVNGLNTIAMGYHPFTISLKDYGSFPSHSYL